MNAILPAQYKILRTFFPLILQRSSTRASLLLREAVCGELSGAEISELETVLRLRESLRHDHRMISVRDYGTGPDRTQRVSAIYRTAAVPHWWGIVLFRIVRTLRPRTVLELGTNLGVSASYLQAGLFLNGTGMLTTIEGDKGLASLARDNLQRLNRGSVTIETGKFQDLLNPVLQRLREVDLVFFDGHHEYDPTMAYFQTVRPYFAARSCLLLDDLYVWNTQLRRAWTDIGREASGFEAYDTGKFGILMSGWGEGQDTLRAS